MPEVEALESVGLARDDTLKKLFPSITDITRNAEGFITSITQTINGKKRTITITRDADNRIIKVEIVVG